MTEQLINIARKMESGEELTPQEQAAVDAAMLTIIPVVQEIARAICEKVDSIAPMFREFLSAAVKQPEFEDILYCTEGRILHLARNHKKARVRKKNRRRVAKIAKKQKKS